MQDVAVPGLTFYDAKEPERGATDHHSVEREAALCEETIKG